MVPQVDKSRSFEQFPGFTRPESNYYRLPNDWFDIWQQARLTLADGDRPARIIAPLKVTEYVIKHSWGWQNFSEPIRLSRADLRQGRQDRQKNQLDQGTGLGSETTVSRGIELAIQLGVLEQHHDNTDSARQARYYLPHLTPHPADELSFESENFTGFTTPTQNYFVVPKAWSDIVAGLKSEVQILTIEYFFRHTWGWQMRDGEIRWLDADEVTHGRRYHTPERHGERYDRGIGYSTRQVRDALTAGVAAGLLVWRYTANGQREYALCMTWMTGIIDGYYDAESAGTEKPVRLTEKSVGLTEKPVDLTEKSVGPTEKPVDPPEKTVPLTEKPVDRTYKDTSDKTSLQNTPGKTAATKNRPVPPDAADVSINNDFKIYFRPVLADGSKDDAQRVTVPEAAEAFLEDNGILYWSDADLENPRDIEAGETFTPDEIAVQIAIDAEIFGGDYGVAWDNERFVRRPLIELVQQDIEFAPDLWDLIGFPRPPEIEAEGERRLGVHSQLVRQAAEWGDPSLITALEKIKISPTEAQKLIDQYDFDHIGGWLRHVRQRSQHLHNPAGLLIKKLRDGEPPPNGTAVSTY